MKLTQFKNHKIKLIFVVMGHQKAFKGALCYFNEVYQTS